MTHELLVQLGEFVSKKTLKKSGNSRERYHWRVLDTKIQRNLKYGDGAGSGHYEDCFVKYAFDVASLLNGFDLYGRKLVVKRKIVRNEIKKKKKLPLEFHNALVLMGSKNNSHIKHYFELIGE